MAAPTPLRLLGTEPPVTDWTPVPIGDVAARVRACAPAVVPFVVAVDGRSGGGKSTLARRLADELSASVLSTDDFAWWHSLFDWAPMLITQGIEPLRAGRRVDVRPPAWVERGRPGSIVAAPADVVIVEGVGAGQSAMRAAVDVVVWVQSDTDEAERRGVERDLAERPDSREAKRFWDEWMAQENPFQESQRTWEVADVIVCGTPAAAGFPDASWLLAQSRVSSTP